MKIKISIEHDSTQIPVVGKMIHHLCVVTDTGHHPSVNKIELAVVELLNNIVNYSGAAPETPIDIQCRFNGGDFSVTISAVGQELSEELAREYASDSINMPGLDTGIDNLPESGWGIQLIKSACDKVSYQRVKNKNVYKLIFDLSSEIV